MKKTLLIAAAALAASVISSEAQVYSQNIVGYVNTVVHGGYNLVNNPLNNSAGNALTNLFPAADTSQVLIWTGSSFNSYTFDTDHWVDDNTSANADATLVNPGIGAFYVNPSPSNTLTFVGSVVAAPGTSVTNVVLGGFRLLGSKIPYAGSLTNATSLNLPQQDTAQVFKWNTSSYLSYTYDTDHWVDDNTSANANAVTINVGEGFFFVEPNASQNWVQSL